ncbi:hypothetical protein ACFL67_03715 [candidate division KSB1 bacterium]
MRKTNIKILFIVLILSVVSTTARGQEYEKVFIFKIGQSLNVLPERFRNYWKDSYAISSGIGYRLNKNLEIRGILNYQSWAFQKHKFIADYNVAQSQSITISGKSVSSISAIMEIIAFFKTDYEQYSPYVTYGIGMFRMNASETIVRHLDTRIGSFPSLGGTVVGMNWGFGMDIYITPDLVMSLESKYLLGFTENGNTGTFLLQTGFMLPLFQD